MARRTQTVTIDNEKSRDHGKSFLITEKSAGEAEEWAEELLCALIAEGADIGPIGDTPLAQLAATAFKALAKLSKDRRKWLGDTLMSCVQVQIPSGQTRALLPNEIEEITTIFMLKQEAFMLHVHFFGLGGE